MDPNQEKLKALKAFKLNSVFFADDRESASQDEMKFQASQRWLNEYEEYSISTTPQASRRNNETREYPSGLTNEFVDNLLPPRTTMNSKKPTTNDISAFVNGLTRRNSNNAGHSHSNLRNNNLDDRQTAIAQSSTTRNSRTNNNSSLSTSESTSQFNYQQNRFDGSPPRKFRVVEQKIGKDSNCYPLSTQISAAAAVDIALRQRDEEAKKLQQTKDEIEERNKIVLADKSSFKIDFKSAAQQHHLNQLKNKPNRQPQCQGPRIGLSKNYTKRTNESFKSPMMEDNSKETPSINEGEGQEDDHPLMKNIEPEILEKIRKEITVCTDEISFDDVAGLHEAKKMIYEAVVLPLLRPDIFTGLRSAPKGILLFGPPGTGKTMIGKCIARQASATFFCISSATLTSKWIGEGEKLVRALFLYARVKQPSVIFIDEIDSILTRRSENECEANRRLKTEFLIQLEGATSNAQDNVLLIGATNLPQELDEAAKRRFTRRLYIPLPDIEARRQLLTLLLRLNANRINERELEWIAQSTEGYSGSDIKNLCKDVAMQPLREIPPEELMKTDAMNFRPILLKDFKESLRCVKATVSKESLESYMKWNEAYGST